MRFVMNTRYGRSDRIRTCGIDVPNVARYQLRHTPKCEKYSIFRSFSVSGQICGQNILSVFFWKGKHSKKAMFTRTFLQCLQALSEFCSLARSALLPAGASPPPACSQSKRVTVTLHPDKYVHAERAWTYYIKTFIDCQYQAGISLW